ncbi:glycoside hydrolase family 3 N-terminal domain-containing protein [Arachnia propionica]|uniref:glycoside hydrolase family 3 N-terminal domain-containing protein n=1 Tax=Arachnia propionica TaxID=1750 RepID=UPI0028ED1ED5|nr:glycoside hydrolase family 3 N-terminal domain-containing protein [Arachnia propionica]
MFTEEQIPELLAQLTLEEKCSLLSGSDFWHTQPVERLGIPALMVSDGPHGLRKQAVGADEMGLEESAPATCFPTAAALASTWDVTLLTEIGRALAEEAKAQGVGVILGPGVNLKRSPLCGRNFEYFSEDPLLAGELAAALAAGIQSGGVGTSVKHFAANNQETDRMRTNARIDERTLREIYLSIFERIIERARPATLMCSYNRINDVYSSENRWLLTEVLREEWGFDGLVMTDWGRSTTVSQESPPGWTWKCRPRTAGTTGSSPRPSGQAPWTNPTWTGPSRACCGWSPGTTGKHPRNTSISGPTTNWPARPHREAPCCLRTKGRRSPCPGSVTSWSSGRWPAPPDIRGPDRRR